MGNTASSSKLKQSNIYAEILRDAHKLRSRDRKKDYNPHRREQSIAMNLPEHLQNYSSALHVVNEWWLEHIHSLDAKEQQQLMMVLYCHLYLNCKPFRGVLFFADSAKTISNALEMLNVFGYLIRSLIDPSKHSKLFQQLRALGMLALFRCV